jgi:hypothetical protein
MKVVTSCETLQSSEEEEEKSSWSSSSGEGSDITVMLGPSMEAAVRCRVLRSGGVRGDSVCCCCIAAPRCQNQTKRSCTVLERYQQYYNISNVILITQLPICCTLTHRYTLCHETFHIGPTFCHSLAALIFLYCSFNHNATTNFDGLFYSRLFRAPEVYSAVFLQECSVQYYILYQKKMIFV